MREDLKQQIEDRLSEMPDKIREIVTTSNWEEKVQLIGRQQNLLLDQITDLQTETFLTMLGISDPRDFTNNIQNQLNIGGGLARTITTEINEKIFKEIKEEMVAIYEEDLQIEEQKSKMPAQISPSETLIGEHLGLNRNQMVDEMKEHIEIIDDEEDEAEDIISKKLTDINKTEKEDVSIDNDRPLPEKNSTPGEIQNNLAADPYRETF